MKEIRAGLIAVLMGLVLGAPVAAVAEDNAEEAPTLCEDGTECPTDDELEETYHQSRRSPPLEA